MAIREGGDQLDGGLGWSLFGGEAWLESRSLSNRPRFQNPTPYFGSLPKLDSWVVDGEPIASLLFDATIRRGLSYKAAMAVIGSADATARVSSPAKGVVFARANDPFGSGYELRGERFMLSLLTREGGTVPDDHSVGRQAFCSTTLEHREQIFKNPALRGRPQPPESWLTPSDSSPAAGSFCRFCRASSDGLCAVSWAFHAAWTIDPSRASA